MRANKTRSTLTALGVIIGIVAVTLMGTAINGIQTGFDKSMAMLGDDVLYVSQLPWARVNDWWNYRDRREIKTEYAEPINRMIDGDAELEPDRGGADLECDAHGQVRRQPGEQHFHPGHDLGLSAHLDGRFHRRALLQRTGIEGRGQCLPDSATMWPTRFSRRQVRIEKEVLINGQQFKVLGVGARQGSFLGLFSLDSIVIVPLPTFQKILQRQERIGRAREGERQDRTGGGEG